MKKFTLPKQLRIHNTTGQTFLSINLSHRNDKPKEKTHTSRLQVTERKQKATTRVYYLWKSPKQTITKERQANCFSTNWASVQTVITRLACLGYGDLISQQPLEMLGKFCLSLCHVSGGLKGTANHRLELLQVPRLHVWGRGKTNCGCKHEHKHSALDAGGTTRKSPQNHLAVLVSFLNGCLAAGIYSPR